MATPTERRASRPSGLSNSRIINPRFERALTTAEIDFDRRAEEILRVARESLEYQRQAYPELLATAQRTIHESQSRLGCAGINRRLPAPAQQRLTGARDQMQSRMLAARRDLEERVGTAGRPPYNIPTLSQLDRIQRE